jgi:hypothetical protein
MGEKLFVFSLDIPCNWLHHYFTSAVNNASQIFFLLIMPFKGTAVFEGIGDAS